MALPTAGNDVYKATAGESKQLGFVLKIFGMSFDLNSLLKNDSDTDGDNLEIISAGGQSLENGTVTVEGDSGGKFTILADGSFYFDGTSGFEYLAAGETAVTSVTYTISDGNGGTSTATVSVTVTGVDGDEAAAVADSASVLQDNTVTDIDLLSNDTVGAQLVSVNGEATNIDQPVQGENGGVFIIDSQGIASFDPNGEFDYLNVGETATTSITYTIGSNGSTASATLTVTVEGVDDTPVVQGEFFEVDAGFNGNLGEVWPLVIEGIPYDLDLDGLLKNDKDPDGSKLKIVSVDGNPGDAQGNFEVMGSNGGIFKILSNGHFDFSATEGLQTLGAGEMVETSVTYTVSDETGNTAEAVATVRVMGQVLAEDDSFVFDDFLGNVAFDSLTDNDFGTTNVVNYDLTGASYQIFNTVYDTVWSSPAGQQNHATSVQSSSFSYTISDEDGNTDTATVQLAFKGRATAFQAGEQAVTDVRLSDGETFILNLNQVLTGDSASLSVDDRGSNVPDFGTLTANGFTVNDLGGFVYQIVAPDIAFGGSSGGEALIHYKNSDGTYVEEVTINFASFGSDLHLATGQQLDLAQDDFFVTTETTAHLFSPSVLLNDQDGLTLVDLQPLFVEGITADAGDFRLASNDDIHYGKLARTGSSFDFRDGLNEGETEVLQFEYTVVDDFGNYDSAILNLQIEGVNSGIVTSVTTNHYVVITEDQTVTFDDTLFLENFYDMDNWDALGGGGSPDAWGKGLSIANMNTTLMEGQLIDHGDGTYTYDPTVALDYLADGDFEADVLRFDVISEDGSIATNLQWTFTVYGVDDPVV